MIFLDFICQKYFEAVQDGDLRDEDEGGGIDVEDEGRELRRA